MGQVIAKFPESIFFSNKKGEKTKNDFFFSIYKNHEPDKKKINDTKEKKYPQIYILGLEQLFKNDESIGITMDHFAKSFHSNGDDNWSVTYGDSPYGNCLTVTCVADKLNDSFNVSFQLSCLYEFSAKFKDKEAIGLTVYFDDFDVLCPDLEKNIVQNYIVTANELAYVDDTAIICNGARVKTVPHGEKAYITWSGGNVEKCNFSLYNENGDLVANTPSYEVTINEDRKFLLKLEKDGHIIFQRMPVNERGYVNEFAILDSKGNIVDFVHKGETVKVIWSGGNLSKCEASLCDESGNVVAKESPYEVTINEDKKFTLILKKDGEETTQTLSIFCTLWEKEYICNKIPCNSDGIKFNNLFYHQNKYYIFIHPSIYVCENLSENNWEPLFIPDPPSNAYYYDFRLWSSENKISICYTCDDEDIIIKQYDIGTNTWTEKRISKTRILIDAKADGENNLLFCELNQNRIFFAVFEHVVYIYDAHNENDLPLLDKIKINDQKNLFNILSIDTSYIDQKIAILYNDNNLYFVTIYSDFKSPKQEQTYQFKNFNKQTKVFLANTNKTYVVLDNYVIDLNNNETFLDPQFSPIDTITDKNQGFMLVGSKEENGKQIITAIVQDETETSLWTYKDDEVTPS